MRHVRRAGCFVASLGLMALLDSSLQAATLTVTNNQDSGPGSLRDAVALASAGDEIVFDALLAGTPIVLTSGQISIEKNLTITGLGQDDTILDGNQTSRIFEILAPAVVTLSGMTIRNGFEQHIVPGPYGDSVIAEGGGVYNSGTLTLNDSGVRQCTVTFSVCESGHCRFLYGNNSVKGGGLFNSGVLTVNHCAIEYNRADSGPSYGGGIFNSGSATLVDTSIQGNGGLWDGYSPGLLGIGIFNDDNGAMSGSDLSVTGNSQGSSPAIMNEGSLELTRAVIAGNSSWSGGGLLNYGAATLVECTISHNGTWAGGAAFGYAAGITNRGDLTLTRSIVSYNGSEGDGGIVSAGSRLRVSNSTIAGNDAYRGVGGIVGCNFLVENSTITGNLRGGISASSLQNAKCKGSVLVGNIAWDGVSPSDCRGTVTSLGHNTFGHGEGCVWQSEEGDQVGVTLTDALESQVQYGTSVPVVADNGGPTYTVALLPDSPAVDAIPASACTDSEGHPVLVDQRGVPRPQGDACDAGAFEYSAPRGEGFWAHQCAGKGYAQVSPELMQAMLMKIEDGSSVFPELAPCACDFISPKVPRNDLRMRAEQELLSSWLNLSSGKLTRGRPIDLPDLTDATTVGDALAEIELTLCDPDATRGDVGNALRLAEALNAEGEDLELMAAESVVTLQPGATRTITLGLINLSPGNRNYRIHASGPWPVKLSATRVDALGSGEIKKIFATVSAPSSGTVTDARIHITAVDLLSQNTLSRDAVILLKVAGDSSIPRLPEKPRLIN